MFADYIRCVFPPLYFLRLSPEIFMKRPVVEGNHWRLDCILKRKAVSELQLSAPAPPQWKVLLGLGRLHRFFGFGRAWRQKGRSSDCSFLPSSSCCFSFALRLPQLLAGLESCCARCFPCGIRSLEVREGVRTSWWLLVGGLYITELCRSCMSTQGIY